MYLLVGQRYTRFSSWLDQNTEEGAGRQGLVPRNPAGEPALEIANFPYRLALLPLTEERRVDMPRAEGVYANPAVAQFVRHGACEGAYGGLACVVDGDAGESFYRGEATINGAASRNRRADVLYRKAGAMPASE